MEKNREKWKIKKEKIPKENEDEMRSEARKTTTPVHHRGKRYMKNRDERRRRRIVAYIRRKRRRDRGRGSEGRLAIRLVGKRESQLDESERDR